MTYTIKIICGYFVKKMRKKSENLRKQKKSAIIPFMEKEIMKQKQKLNILILSCSTGGGHNAAGMAMKEYLEAQGHYVDFPDYLSFAGERVSEAVSRIYVKTVQKAPKVFGAVYKIGDAVSRHVKKSIVYYANSGMDEYLRKCLEKTDYDAVLVPHLFPAETLTSMKRKGIKLPLTVAIGTDYTSIPFWGETDCDYYVVPSKEVGEEFIQAGIPKHKVLPYGIPTSLAYSSQMGREEAAKKIFKEKVFDRQNQKLYLVAGGSMGAGNISQLVRELKRQGEAHDFILVVCGSNKKLEEKLRQEFESEQTVLIYGWTNEMPVFMQAADVLFTKPGGLTSTEAATARCPMVHINPIPGCETANMNYFVRRGYSISAKGAEQQAAAGIKLAYDEKLREQMKAKQQAEFKGDTAEKIETLIYSKISRN